MDAEVLFKVNLFGVFRLERHGVGEVAISSRKARALLAVLALSPRGERSRIWLQDILWSGSKRLEAQASLRRELSTLRHALGVSADRLLLVGREKVRLQLEHCEIDALLGAAPEGMTLLEGLDLADSEGFEDWLRAERGVQRAKALPAATNTVTQLLVALELDIDRLATGPVALVPDMLAQAVAIGLKESGLVRIRLTERSGSGPAPDIMLRIRSTAAGDASWIVIVAHRFSDGALLMSRQDAISTSGGWVATNSRVSVIAGWCVDRLLREVLPRPTLQEGLQLTHRTVMSAMERWLGLAIDDIPPEVKPDTA
jgi:hypothetical protein